MGLHAYDHIQNNVACICLLIIFARDMLNTPSNIIAETGASQIICIYIYDYDKSEY